MLEAIGRIMIWLGGSLLILGLVLFLAGKLPGLGRLPGDLLIERENFRLFIPLGTMVVLSLLLTLLLNLIARLTR